MSSFHALSMVAISGDTVEFSMFESRYCLVVNVASR
jgi:glutathione peroxidase-family protein